ncbi:MAG: alpha-galactosidase [Clostridia bacterium]|nr:alpha-galactosidase [Clostridia bacterium]
MGVSGWLFARGSFGVVDSEADYVYQNEGEKLRYAYTQGGVRFVTEFEPHPNGAVIRRDYCENLTDVPVEINAFCSRFFMEGNRYEAYTQYNGWQHESSGGWQPLVTQVVAADCGIRTCDGATPMLALSNAHSGKTTVFHILPNCQWKIAAKKRPLWGRQEAIVVEIGMEESGLSLTAAPHEKIYLPTVIFYETESKTDLGAYKLHEVFNGLYPRKQMPIMYNTWLLNFDHIDVDNILRQVDCAAELGVEMFMVDAGWFGEGENWFGCVGDWTENLTGGTAGRLLEISKKVREKGMIFGLWFEPERAASASKIQKNHPEYFTQGVFLNFADEKARTHIYEQLCSAIEKYQIGFLKFDFNQSVAYDESGNAFYRYLQGQRAFVEALRARYPYLYITNCASGGARTELGQATLFDSFWFTDNQGPYEGLTIVKNTLKRMPTALIERWNVQTFCDGFPQETSAEPRRLPISCNNATWDYVMNVSPQYTYAFLTGGPMGFSCDVASFPDDYKAELKEFIAKYKQEREFYKKATARILVDEKDITVLEYADAAFNKCQLQIFTKLVYTEAIRVYPTVDKSAVYVCNGTRLTGAELADDGLYVGGVAEEGLKDNSCICITLDKVL